MTEQELLQQLSRNPESIRFEDSIAVIDSQYDFEQTSFTNGDLQNAAGQNNGSCKIFAFAKLHSLDAPHTLHLFGDYYRKDVLENPDAKDHQNIRNFLQFGWTGVHFAQSALHKK